MAKFTNTEAAYDISEFREPETDVDPIVCVFRNILSTQQISYLIQL
jgi:hypothetical protein